MESFSLVKVARVSYSLLYSLPLCRSVSSRLACCSSRATCSKPGEILSVLRCHWTAHLPLLGLGKVALCLSQQVVESTSLLSPLCQSRPCLPNLSLQSLSPALQLFQLPCQVAEVCL